MIAIGFDKNRWIYRQTFLTKAVVFFFLFLLAAIIGNIVVDYLVGDVLFWNLPTVEIKKTLFKTVSGSLVWALIITYFSHTNRKLASGKAA